MKKYLLLIASLGLLLIAGVSCDKRIYDVPEIKTPVYTTDSDFITIAELKAYALKNPGLNKKNNSNNYEFGYLQDPSVKDEIYPNAAKIIPFPDKKAIKAIVVGDDESGNIYKQLYLQDKTGGILLTVDMTGLFGTYRVGQEVIIELQGLCIGRYYGAFQIGSPAISKSAAGNYNMSRLKPYDFYKNVHANGAPDINNANALIRTITEIPAAVGREPEDSVYAGREPLFNTLVRFENVSFVGGGELIFGPLTDDGKGQTISRQITVNGTNINVRNSSYANFAGDTMPGSPCNITAIFSQFYGNYQVTLRTRKDIEIIK